MPLKKFGNLWRNASTPEMLWSGLPIFRTLRRAFFAH
jgi:hypothetical protein